MPRTPPFLLVPACAALLLGGCKTRPVQTAGPPPAVPVTTAMATAEQVPIEVHAVGTVEPSATVQVKSQVEGQLMRVGFAEGAFVNKGDLLFVIDPRPFQEALRQAEAALVKDQALLKQYEANLSRDQAQLANAEADAARYEKLSRDGVASVMQYDQYRTAAAAQREIVRASEAAIGSAHAAIEADRAAVARAKLDLSYCEIRSPITGRAGNLLVHAGNLVKANDVALVVINQISPIYASFAVPQRYLDAIRQRSAGRQLPVQIAPGTKTVAASLSSIDNTVDPNTGTIRLKAISDNRERLLWPGQFVNTTLRLDTENATVVPAEAVQAGQLGSFLYVVKPDQTVEPRQVATGASVNGKTVIEKGVAPGETVVTDGQLRLYPGARIQAVAAGKAAS